MIVSTSELNTYPSQGDTFKFNVRQEATGNPTILFGAQDTSNWYGARVMVATDNFTLRKDTNQLATTSASLSQGVWYEVKVEWKSSDDIVATLLDGGGSSIAQISTTDSEYTSGGVGFRTQASNFNTESYFDHYRIV